MTSLSDTEQVHATCVERNGSAILIAGPSGSGKSDLALRLIDRGATLVSDDYTLLYRESDRLLARSPATIAGKMEVRYLGIIPFQHVDDIPVCLYVDVAGVTERLPGPAEVRFLEVSLPAIAIEAREASAPIKVELAQDRFGSSAV